MGEGEYREMNEINYIDVKQKDGTNTRLTHYCSNEPPKGSILILHGLAEHEKRYIVFVNYLLEHGYDVYIYNHRGHGTERKLSELGFIAPTKGYQLILDDAITISTYIEHHNRSKKLILCGHSMGSLIARNVIQSYDKYHGVILLGTSHPPKYLTKFGIILSSLIIKFKGPKFHSIYLHNMIFGGKKYTKLTTRTAFDWLTRSHPVVGAYIHDPYSGFKSTASCYLDIIKLVQQASRRKLIKQSKRELPILVMSGDKDPVGNYGKDIKKLISIYNKLSFQNLTFKLYPECRHELLNEINQEEVFNDIGQWILKRV